MKMEKRSYFTTLELAEAGLAAAMADPLWAELTEACPLDYVLPSGCCRLLREVVSCDFDALGYATYGGSEGIYGTVQLWGGDWNPSVDLLTLKTLGQDRESFMGLKSLTELLAYHLTQVVSENLDRFD